MQLFQKQALQRLCSILVPYILIISYSFLIGTDMGELPSNEQMLTLKEILLQPR